MGHAKETPRLLTADIAQGALAGWAELGPARARARAAPPLPRPGTFPLGFGASRRGEKRPASGAGLR